MDPNTIAQLALLGLDSALKLIAYIRGQGGLTDEQIMAHAQASVPANAALIQSFLDSLPPGA